MERRIETTDTDLVNEFIGQLTIKLNDTISDLAIAEAKHVVVVKRLELALARIKELEAQIPKDADPEAKQPGV